jgi:hypothetical protein
MRSVFLGAVIIAIGLIWHNSIFLGDFNVLSILTDMIGVCAIIWGLVSVAQTKQPEV